MDLSSLYHRLFTWPIMLICLVLDIWLGVTVFQYYQTLTTNLYYFGVGVGIVGAVFAIIFIFATRGDSTKTVTWGVVALVCAAIFAAHVAAAAYAIITLKTATASTPGDLSEKIPLWGSSIAWFFALLISLPSSCCCTCCSMCHD